MMVFGMRWKDQVMSCLSCHRSDTGELNWRRPESRGNRDKGTRWPYRVFHIFHMPPMPYSSSFYCHFLAPRRDTIIEIHIEIAKRRVVVIIHSNTTHILTCLSKDCHFVCHCVGVASHTMTRRMTLHIYRQKERITQNPVSFPLPINKIYREKVYILYSIGSRRVELKWI